MLSHLIYVSNRLPQCTQQEIDKILDACQRNNKNYDITGVLLYSDTKFIQYIEGEYSQIIQLYDRIKTDKRHSNPVLLTSTPIQKRSFPSWQMGSKKVDVASVDFKTKVSDEDRRVFDSMLAGQPGSDTKAIALINKFFK